MPFSIRWSRFKAYLFPGLSILAISLYAAFLFFWCALLYMAPVAIEDSFWTMGPSVSIPGVSPWVRPTPENPIETKRVKYTGGCMIRSGTIKYLHHRVQLTQILNDGEEWAHLGSCHYSLIWWDALIVPVVATISLLFLLFLFRHLHKRTPAQKQKQ